MHTCRRTGTALLDPEAQAAWCCSLPGFDRRKWRPFRLQVIHMGAPPRWDRECEDGDWHEPLEPVEQDGCPGGWYRTAFVESVLRYARRPDGEGGRVPNRLLDACEDELVIEAVERLEQHEDAWRVERQERQFAKMQARTRAD